ncbi:hypothetical protein N7466_003556 [Penicillium verhagenii]|uniref:uncharacterized protein n=1 Tax=Penicillium verhagenii TaxID=1562060 RepID=UPI0025450DFF|nr:uncharacterized protein N7466_003556 [Penicillium verhagenii]KAJ5937106.1 hypothetical protein N7466_003556 [Penicillium verhagenii]
MQALGAGEESFDQLKDQIFKEDDIWQTSTTNRAQEEFLPFWNEALWTLIAETWEPIRAEWEKAENERKLRAFRMTCETMSFGQLSSEDVERRERKKMDAKLAHQWKSLIGNQVATRHVLPETLENYQLPWKWHEVRFPSFSMRAIAYSSVAQGVYGGTCIVIKESISHDFLVQLFTHSRNLAEKRLEEMIIAARSQMEHLKDPNDSPSKL